MYLCHRHKHHLILSIVRHMLGKRLGSVLYLIIPFKGDPGLCAVVPLGSIKAPVLSICTIHC